jgi:hypothetical protein
MNRMMLMALHGCSGMEASIRTLCMIVLTAVGLFALSFLAVQTFRSSAVLRPRRCYEQRGRVLVRTVLVGLLSQCGRISSCRLSVGCTGLLWLLRSACKSS